jgi:4-hydroxymandelate oxidase
VVLTVDTPVVATKYVADQAIWASVDPTTVRVNFDLGYDGSRGAEKARDLGPADLAWLGQRTGLPVVVKAAVDGHAEVYVDGGARTGLEVLAGLTLGARGAFLGRLPLYALVEGRDGVARMHAELSEQVREALLLAGCRTPAEACGLAHDEPI